MSLPSYYWPCEKNEKYEQIQLLNTFVNNERNKKKIVNDLKSSEILYMRSVKINKNYSMASN